LINVSDVLIGREYVGMSQRVNDAHLCFHVETKNLRRKAKKERNG